MNQDGQPFTESGKAISPKDSHPRLQQLSWFSNFRQLFCMFVTKKIRWSITGIFITKPNIRLRHKPHFTNNTSPTPNKISISRM
jgi:hypothetical protein